MRLVSFALPHDPAPRTGVLAHDGARVVDLTDIGIASFADGVARAPQLARLATHLLHVPGAVAHAPDAVRLLAPARRLAAVYDSATGVPAFALAAEAHSPATVAPFGPDAAIPLAADASSAPPLLGAGIAAVVGRAAHGIDAAEVGSCVAGLALLVCWRSAPGRVTATAIGPWLVTVDELAGSAHAPLAIAVDAALAVNGTVVRGGPWGALTAKLAAAIADASRRAELEPGDAVGVATFELHESATDEPRLGVTGADGAAAGPWRGATAGDRILLEATGLGALRAFVAPESREAVATRAH